MKHENCLCSYLKLVQLVVGQVWVIVTLQDVRGLLWLTD